MPIVLKQEDVQRFGGQYAPAPEPAVVQKPRIVLPPPNPRPPAPPAAASVSVDVAPLRDAIERTALVLDRNHSTSEDVMMRLAAVMSKQGGKWIATVQTRDQHGRILSVEFEQKPTE